MTVCPNEANQEKCKKEQQNLKGAKTRNRLPTVDPALRKTSGCGEIRLSGGGRGEWEIVHISQVPNIVTQGIGRKCRGNARLAMRNK